MAALPLDPDEPSTAIGPPAVPADPEYIGPYRVLSLLGEGGMGAVYLAEQHAPHRRVAIKVIKAGMDTRQVVARFEAERQTLALMDHANIATVFDAGVSADGRPYFAMEYVAGVPITDYCDRNQLTTNQRIELVLDVCAAIHHAHQKGVIHRDIKPSNVLVAVVDGRAVPKVIDFGVAKATNLRLTEKTIFTQLGVLVGTPEYMSPEQAEMTGLDVDTTTDIYSIGVLLYELLVGALPFESARLRRGGYAEIQRIIREEEPARPSTRLSSLGDSAVAVAKRRGTDPPSLARELRGDLDWITLKAMEKDRTRRYGSASEFAADLRRHLSDEPVAARPASLAYRSRKFVRRHRTGTATGALLILLVVGASVTTAVQARRIAAERDRVARERDRAEAVTAFLVSLFEASDPDRSKGEKVSARQLLDLGRERLRTELADQPQARAALLHTVGRVYRLLDLNEPAEAVLSEAVALRRSATGSDRADLADSMSELARVYAGQPDRADALDREVLQIRREVFGEQHLKVSQAIAGLGTNAFFRGRFDEAAAHYRQSADMAERTGNHDAALIARANLAGALLNLGQVDEAVAVFEAARPAVAQAYGAEHTRTQALLNNLGGALIRAGRFKEAEPIHREILRIRRKLLGPAHFDVAVSLYNLAWAISAQGRVQEAEQLYEESLAIHRARGGAARAEHAWVLVGLGSVQNSLGKIDQAETTYRAAIDVFARSADAAPDAPAWAMDSLGSLLFTRGRLPEAEAALRRALDLRTTGNQSPPFAVAGTKELLAQVLCQAGASAEGERLATEAHTFRHDPPGAPAPARAFSDAILGRCLAASRRFDEAEPLLTRAYQTLSSESTPPRDAIEYTVASAVALYEAWGRAQDAAAWRERSRTRR